MAKVDYAAMAPDLLQRIGGEANVSALSHCATRMRFVLKDESKADSAAIKDMAGVVTVVQTGGQYQVVIGNDVPLLFAEMQALLPGLGSEKGEGEKGGAASRNPLDAFIALVSAIFLPVLWTLAGTGLFKAFLAMFATFNWIDKASDTYTVLNAAADAFMNFLPLVLAVTAARHFKANQFTAMAIAGALVYPSIIAMNDGGSHSFLGIPLVIMSYTSSVLPIIVAVWVQSYIERVCNRVFPSAFRNFMTPWITVLIMVPLTLLTIGPLTTTVADGIASALTAGTDYSGALASEPVEPSTQTRTVPSGPERFAYQAADGEKWVDVNLTDDTMTAYVGTTVVHGPVSINHGEESGEWATKLGTYHVYLKNESQDLGCTPGFPYCQKDVPWIAYWDGNFAIHGAPWATEFGYDSGQTSHGCVNAPVEEARWFYDFVEIGTTVVTHE